MQSSFLFAHFCLERTEGKRIEKKQIARVVLRLLQQPPGATRNSNRGRKLDNNLYRVYQKLYKLLVHFQFSCVTLFGNKSMLGVFFERCFRPYFTYLNQCTYYYYVGHFLALSITFFLPLCLIKLPQLFYKMLFMMSPSETNIGYNELSR